MRHTTIVIAFLGVAALAAGCGSTEEKPAVAPKPSAPAAAHLEKAKTETKEAARAMQDYAYAQKAEFIDQMKKELVEIQAEIGLLSDKVDQSSGAAKAEAENALGAVRAKSAEVKARLDKAEGATEATWNDAKGELQKSYGDLKDSVDKTRQWLSDKIAP